MLNKNRFRTLFAIATLALLLISAATVTLAQDDTTANIEIIGRIDVIERGALTVNGLRIDTTTAEIQTTLVIDALVKVEAFLMDDGTIAAREVYAADAGLQPGEIELEGTLEALSLVEAQVSGFSLDVSGAEIGAGVALEARVKVHAQLSPEGVWVVREIETDDEDDDSSESSDDTMTGEDFTIVGTLDAINDDGTLTIGGQVVDVSGAEIEDTLVAGALVKAEIRIVNGIMAASEIERSRTFLREDNDNDDNGNSNDVSNSNDVGNDNDDDFNDNDDDDVNENVGLNSNENCVPSIPAGWTTYTVRRGDTLSAIAAGSGSSVSQLSATNCIPDARFIQVGQQVAVPRTPVISSSGNVNSNDDDGFNDNDDDDNFNDNDDYNDNYDDDDDYNDNDDHNSNDDDDHEDDHDNSNDNESDDD